MTALTFAALTQLDGSTVHVNVTSNVHPIAAVYPHKRMARGYVDVVDGTVIEMTYAVQGVDGPVLRRFVVRESVEQVLAAVGAIRLDVVERDS